MQNPIGMCYHRQRKWSAFSLGACMIETRSVVYNFNQFHFKQSGGYEEDLGKGCPKNIFSQAFKKIWTIKVNDISEKHGNNGQVSNNSPLHCRFNSEESQPKWKTVGHLKTKGVMCNFSSTNRKIHMGFTSGEGRSVIKLTRNSVLSMTELITGWRS